MSTILASTTTTTAYKVTADTTGTLVLQTGATPTTAVTIDASQNVGVGVTPSAKLQVAGVQTITSGSGASSANGLHLWFNTGTNTAYIQGFQSGVDWRNIVYNANNHIWQNTDVEHMRLDASGNFMVGVTTAGSSGVSGFSFNSPTGPSNVWIGHTTGTASGTAYVGFNYNGSGIGSITQNGTTGVLYNLTSDYRLKNNQEDLTGAKDFIMALKPKKWQWWDGSGEGVGFIAHEFMEVAKYSGHGEKDAVETIEIKDENGNVTGTEERPVYQSIQPSSSEVMAHLVAHIQNLETRLAALENK